MREIHRTMVPLIVGCVLSTLPLLVIQVADWLAPLGVGFGQNIAYALWRPGIALAGLLFPAGSLAERSGLTYLQVAILLNMVFYSVVAAGVRKLVPWLRGH